MTPQPTVLIVDDEKHTRDGLRRLLENDYDVYVAADIAGAMDVLEREQVDVLLTDLRLGSEDGMVLIDRALKMSRPPICIMMTAYGSVDVAVEAMKRGAYDFVTKPLNLDKVDLLIARAVQSRKLEQENRALREQVDERYGLENIWGDSPALHEVLETIKQVAPSSANVLIEGESGTGKELAAHAIHNLSRRNKAKFVVVHCAALSPQLLESELFGHEKGAFTGAHERRIGRFEQANGGTLFLDEIAEIDLEHAGQIAARHERRTCVRTRRRQSNVACRCAPDRSHEQEPRTTRARGEIPRRSLFSPQRRPHCDAAVARAKRRHPDSRPRISAPLLQGKPKTASRTRAGRHGRAA